MPVKDRYVSFKEERSYGGLDHDERFKEALHECMNRWMPFFKSLTPRDPARIDRILKLLAIKWKQNPDFRFFQLLEAIFGCPKMRKQCFFAQEDDITEERIKLAIDIGFGNAREHDLAKKVTCVKPSRDDYRTYKKKG